MRYLTILSLSAAVVGCGGGGGSGGKIDMSIAKMNPDMALPPATCDITMQNCGAGHKCVPSVDSTGAEADTCVTDGTALEGATCTPPSSSSSVINDNCKAGLFCDNATLAAPVCRKMCTTDTDCTTSGQRCGDFFTLFFGLMSEANFGWCSPSCTPFVSTAGNCPASQDCGETTFDFDQTAATSTSGPGFFFCKPTGTGAFNTACMSDKDCGPNLWCGILDQNMTGGVCLENCSTGHACDMLPADAGAGGLTASCLAFSDSTTMAGFCTYQ